MLYITVTSPGKSVSRLAQQGRWIVETAFGLHVCTVREWPALKRRYERDGLVVEEQQSEV